MQVKKRKMLAFLLLMMVIAVAVPVGKAKAAEALTIEEIDYELELLTVSSSNGDKYLYYSDAKKKNWECAGQFEGTKFVMDISWVSKTKDYVLVLKGDQSGEVSVTLPKQEKSFKATYNYKDETFTYLNAAKDSEIFWRKADSTVWKKVDMDGETRDAFRRLYARGAILYFRVGQVKGNATSVGARPSKEVKLSLTKQASAPSLTVKHPGTVTVNDKQEYMLERATEWTAVTTKTLEVAKIATAAYYNGTTEGEDTKILIRVAATEKKLPSATATITVRAQEAAPPMPVEVPDESETSEETSEKKDTNYIKYDFVNVSTIEFVFEEIKDDDGNVITAKPSSKNPYEYTVVEKDSQLKDDAAWTAITSEKFQLTAQKAPEGSKVYIRKRGRLESTTVWQPESLACAFPMPEYPKGGTVNVDGDTSAAYMKDGTLYLVKEEGAEASGLKFSITSLEFKNNDVTSITCGGKSLTFKSTKSSDEKFNVEITSTSAYESAVTTRDTEETVKITLKNGEVIENVKLKILHGASVKSEKTFTVTHGLEPGETYEFVVVPGLTFPEENGKYAETTVAKLTFMGEDIDKYSTSKEADGSYTVTLTTASFDGFFLKKGLSLDKESPLTIIMSNGQKIEKGINIKLREEVKTENSISVTMSLGGTLSNEIVLTLTGGEKIVIKGASWNGVDISKSSWEAVEQGGKITVTFKVEAFKELTIPSGKSSTAPVIFKLEYSGGNSSSLASQIFWLTLD